MRGTYARPPLHPRSTGISISEPKLKALLNNKFTHALQNLKDFNELPNVLDKFALYIARIITKYPMKREWCLEYMQAVQLRIQNFYLKKHAYRLTLSSACSRIENAERKVCVNKDNKGNLSSTNSNMKRKPIQWEIRKKFFRKK